MLWMLLGTQMKANVDRSSRAVACIELLAALITVWNSLPAHYNLCVTSMTSGYYSGITRYLCCPTGFWKVYTTLIIVTSSTGLADNAIN